MKSSTPPPTTTTKFTALLTLSFVAAFFCNFFSIYTLFSRSQFLLQSFFIISFIFVFREANAYSVIRSNKICAQQQMFVCVAHAYTKHCVAIPRKNTETKYSNDVLVLVTVPCHHGAKEIAAIVNKLRITQQITDILRHLLALFFFCYSSSFIILLLLLFAVLMCLVLLCCHPIALNLIRDWIMIVVCVLFVHGEG